MTTLSGETITFTMNYRDADQYSTWARRPALASVRDAIRQGVREYNRGVDSRVTVTITREDAEAFVRKSTRPWRLPSGATVKSLIQLALDTPPETPSAAQADDSDDADLDASDVTGESVETPLDVHSEEPDQEPSPVADESEPEFGPGEDVDNGDGSFDEDESFEGGAGELEHESIPDAPTGDLAGEPEQPSEFRINYEGDEPVAEPVSPGNSEDVPHVGGLATDEDNSSRD